MPFAGGYPGAYSHNAYTSVSGLGGNGYPGSYYPSRRFGAYNNGYNGYNSQYNTGYYNSNGYIGGGGATTYPYGGVGYTAGTGYY